MCGFFLHFQFTQYRKALSTAAQQLPEIPWMLIYGDKDKTCNSRLVKNTRKFVPQLKVVKLEGISHWVMIEARQEVTKLVLDFVRDELERPKSRL